MATDGLFRLLNEAWRAFRDSYARLSEVQITQPGVTGEWSVKDVIAHVTTWEEEALKYVPLIIAGGRPPTYKSQYGGIDAFNARMHATRRGLSLAEVLRQAEETHTRLLELLQSLPEEQLRSETRARRRLRLDTYHHYGEHAAMISAWRQAPQLRAEQAP
jgi:hypothetical protein